MPRLWLKLSLESRGQLAPGYPGCGTGFDQMVIEGLGLQRDAVINFIKTRRPSYPQFETWIKSQPGAKVDKESVDKLNRAIRGYNHDDETRKSILGSSGIPDDAKAPRDAISLNNLDEWKELHEAALK